MITTMLNRVLAGLLVAVTLAAVVQSWRLTVEQGRRELAETSLQGAQQRIHDVEQRAKTLAGQVDAANAEQRECAVANASNLETLRGCHQRTGVLRDETLRLDAALARARRSAREGQAQDDAADRALAAEHPNPDTINTQLRARGAGWLFK